MYASTPAAAEADVMPGEGAVRPASENLDCAALLIAVGGEHWMRALGRVRKALCPPHPQWLAGQPLNMVYTMLGASTMVPVGLLMFWLAP